MKKYFVITDVHGFYNEMRKALDDAGFDINNPEHFLISCGDAMDRGEQPKEVLEFLLSVPEDRRALVKGNHEWMYEEAIHRGYLASHDIHNGADKTFIGLTGVKDHNHALIAIDNCELYKKYMASLVDFYETDNYIFVHGWIPSYPENWREAYAQIWQDSRYGATWANGMEEWYNGFREDGKTIVCGHYHTSWGHRYLHHDGSEFGKDAKFTPFIDDGIIALDACTVYSGFCNCVVLGDN